MQILFNGILKRQSCACVDEKRELSCSDLVNVLLLQMYLSSWKLLGALIDLNHSQKAENFADLQSATRTKSLATTN